MSTPLAFLAEHANDRIRRRTSPRIVVICVSFDIRIDRVLA